MEGLSGVYDLFCPSPPSLQVLTTMQVSVDLWRREIQQNITVNGTLAERYPRKKTALSCPFTDLQIPRTIALMVEPYVFKLATAIPDWLSHHFDEKVLVVESYKLYSFSDFVLDFDGSIHYGRTAKRFVACKGISDYLKFKMACEYCLEDDISMLWPLVSKRFAQVGYNFSHKPKVGYWLDCLKNKLDDVRKERYFTNILREEDSYRSKWSWVQYFFTQLPIPIVMRRLLVMSDFRHDFTSPMFNIRKYTFCRYILPKLEEAELTKWMRGNWFAFITFGEREHGLRIWDHLKHYVSDEMFCNLVACTLYYEYETKRCKVTSYFSDLWTSAPDRLKQAAINHALLLDRTWHTSEHHQHCSCDLDFSSKSPFHRNVLPLAVILLDASKEQRKLFWHKFWSALVCDYKLNDFRLLMNLCFDNNEHDMNSFKEEATSSHFEEIYLQFERLFVFGQIKELEGLMTFFCLKEPTITEVHLDLLQDHFVEEYGEFFDVSWLDKFIDNAFEDEYLADEFKNELRSQCDSESVEFSAKSMRTHRCCFWKPRYLIDFVDAFVPCEDTVMRIKQRYFAPLLKYKFEFPSFFYDSTFSDFGDFQIFISWICETADDVADFKKGLNMDNIIQTLTEIKELTIKVSIFDYDWFGTCFQGVSEPESSLERFVKWYFVTPEDVEMFRRRYTGCVAFNRLLLRF